MAAIVGKRGEKAAEDKGKTAQVTKYCGRLPGCDCKCSWVVMHVVGIRKSHFFAVNGRRKEGGRRKEEGGADILIDYLKVGSLCHPFEFMHINKIAHENMQSIL